ncbi:MAG: Xaut [Candidatus Solibacter sp.]|nr:Xaut [Candidatus Solibacter sp.]
MPSTHFGKAEEYGSKAKVEGFDPFAITPRAPAAAPSRIRDKWALIIGVSSFAKSDDFLEFSVADAKELADTLVQAGNFKKSNIRLLVDREATTSNIREAFGEIREKAQQDDLVLVYISSHGHPRDLDPTGLSYVLTYDTDTRDSAKVFATALQMVELAELGRWVRAQGYVLLLDTCFSGAARPGVAGKIVPAGTDGFDPLQGLQGSGNRVVISASQATERSYEDPENRHGYFTRFLLEALRQSGQPQPLSSIFEYVRTRVSAAVERQDGRQQRPVMQQFGQGKDIVLNTPVTTAAIGLGGGRWPSAAAQWLGVSGAILTGLHGPQ